MHDELASLLAGLHLDPADDALWAVTSDWLEENGWPGRAELMRLRTRLRQSAKGRGRAALEARAIALIEAGEIPCVPEIANSVGMRLALVPAGTFLMGSPEGEEGRYDDEGPRHEVTVTRPFWIGVFPVTQAEWRAVTGESPSHFAPTGSGRTTVRKRDTSAHPVDNVSWEDCEAFCAKLSSLPAEQAAGRRCRLPTEAEWEMCCRGGITSHPYHFGPQMDKGRANYDATGLGRTCPVGQFAPNAFGLHDAHGQVWEWCGDWFARFERGARTDPKGPDAGEGKVLRGGSWSATPAGCRASFRGSISPELRNYYYGLRVACSVDG
ncbi:MAG: SUMF1/EgtB/PvdO family nonheme iron enzyme [Gemmataceae bacterium]|nr:SUMF1/EgtB/PvdO family nonheme iron enzyme [Gemmataceae bacterium]